MDGASVGAAPRLHARSAVERRVEGGVEAQPAAVGHVHDAPVLPGPRAVEHRDGATHVERVGGTDTVAQCQLDATSAAVDENATEVVAGHWIRGHRLAVARVHVLEVVVRMVDVLAVAGRVVVEVAAPAHLGSTGPHRVPLKDNLLDLVRVRVRVRVRVGVRVR